ncbi:preprotein translocase subunit SecG [Gammaproteobacteria bacterium]|nr:preprotein translocase subunit SecG [Gammaproteobacteria bacterium]
MQTVLIVIHSLICVCLIALVIVQQGRGADAGITFGSGNASSVFGASGSTSFLVKLTTIFAVLFFVTTLLLGVQAKSLNYAAYDDLLLEDLLENAEVVE